MSNVQELERLLKALANRRRLSILKYLKRVKRASVGDVADEIKLSFKSTSRHLSVLSSADVIEKEQEGLVVWHMIVRHGNQIVTKTLELL